MNENEKNDPAAFDPRFDEAIRRIDDANREDPRTDEVDGAPQPRELRFAQRVYEWVRRLSPSASEALLLAARGHTIRRWHIPRDNYDRTTLGYHEWRDALARFHATETAKILVDVGYASGVVDRVEAFIVKKNWPQDAEACVLEDADCLAFVELKLSNYVDEWGEDKTLRILKSTVKKMTTQGRGYAVRLELGERERTLIERAAQ